jgi:hypothetical protein
MINIVRKTFIPKNDGLDSFRQKEVEISNEAAGLLERLPEEFRGLGGSLFLLGRQSFEAEIAHAKALSPDEKPKRTYSRPSKLGSGTVDRRTREYKRNQK